MIILFCDTLILLIKNQKKILFKSIKSVFLFLKKIIIFDNPATNTYTIPLAVDQIVKNLTVTYIMQAMKTKL